MVVVVEGGVGGGGERETHKQRDTNKKKVIFDENFAAPMFPVKGGARLRLPASPSAQTHAKDSFSFSKRQGNAGGCAFCRINARRRFPLLGGEGRGGGRETVALCRRALCSEAPRQTEGPFSCLTPE